MALSSLLFLFIIFIKTSSTTAQFCRNSCSPTNPDMIRFPFGLNNSCNYPGFSLSCDHQKNQAIITLPKSGNFIVHSIYYQTQEIHVKDPSNCLAQRFLNNFSLSESPFVRTRDRAFTFLNCSLRNMSETPFPPSSRFVACLSNENFTVVAIPSAFIVKSMDWCVVMKDNVDVPVFWHRNNGGETTLFWSEPDCRDCEQRGGTCGFKNNLSLDVACYNPPTNGRIPRSAKYGIIIGVGIPGLLCMIGLCCYLCGRLRAYSRRHRSTAELTATFPRPPPMSPPGLDGTTIELYPKTLLGESRRLPNANDNTCPICLCEYQPKETLRTIPECNHYFHAQCVDEWLKMNATCPLCRNSPDVCSMTTISSPSSSSLAATPSPTSSSTSSSSMSLGEISYGFFMVLLMLVFFSE